MAGLDVGLRYIHIVSAVALTGGLLFWAACLLPAMRLLDDTFRRSMLALALQRFRGIVLLSAVGLVASGIYNWIRANAVYTALRGGSDDSIAVGQILIGSKALLGLVLLALVVLKTVAPGDETRQRRWLSLSLQLAAVVILLGAVLRYLRMEYLAQIAQAANS